MSKPTEEELHELFLLHPVAAVRRLQLALQEVEDERDEAQTVALNLCGYFMSCCVCGADLHLPAPPHCIDECHTEGDGECMPGEEWKCNVENALKRVESWRKAQVERSLRALGLIKQKPAASGRLIGE